MKHCMKQGLMHDSTGTMEMNRKYKKRRISEGSVSGSNLFKADEHLNTVRRKKMRTFKEPPANESIPVASKATKFGKQHKPQIDSKKSAKKVRRLQLLEANKEENKVINRLEKLLHMKKRKKKKKIPAVFAGDGLDYILEVLDNPDSENEKDVDLNEDLPIHLSNKQKNSYGSEEDEELFDDNSSDSQSLEESEMYETNSECDLSNNEDDEVDMEIQSTGSVVSHEDDSKISVSGTQRLNDKSEKHGKQKPEVWEDIYGRLRDKDGNVLPNPIHSSEVFIPRAKRINQQSVSDERKETLERIQKQLRNLENRLGESNMHHICNVVEEMYMKYSRNDMNEVLLSLLWKRLLSPEAETPHFIIEHAMFIAVLHGNIGSEIGAFFLQNLVLKLDELLKGERNEEWGKTYSNLLTYLCHLYNFKVTDSLLIFDVLRLLKESFQEIDIELIILILKNAGFTLRRDDPLALKDFLLSVQSKAAAFKPGQNQSRVRFMLELLDQVRNNNMEKVKKCLDYDPSIIEHLKKALRAHVRKGKSIQQLSISYEDLLKAHERGCWWIVGSAWSDRASQNTSDATVQDHVSGDNSVSDKTLLLAKKLRINSEIRRSILNAILTAQDYLNAFEKLLRLKLKRQQEKEIIGVLLHCCLQEKNFNPFYAYLASRFCKYDRRFNGYLKFCLWDKFKELENMKLSQRSCLASLLVHLFTTESLDISVLKVIHFSEMNKPMVQFFRKILTAILLHEREEICSKVFQRVASNSNLNLLRESLRLFMHHFILQRMSQVDDSTAEKLKQRVKIAENVLNSAKHAFKL